MSTKKVVISATLALMIFVSLFAIPVATASSNENQEENEIKVKEVITAYFELRYEALKSLKPADFSTVSDTSKASTITDEWLRREQERQDIELFIAETFGTNYTEYKFYLDYKSIAIKDSYAVVTLLESHDVYFATNPTSIAKMANLEHVITLTKVDGSWKLTNDNYRDETIELMETLSKEEIFQNVRINHDSQFLDQDTENQPSQPEANYTYNGPAAAAYADTWWNSINPTYHDEPGNNDCTNFASQAIYKGTNQTMSNPDNYNTKWYYDFPTHTGSYPWVNVGGIFTFLTTNTGKGPYGYHSGAYLCNLGKGSIVTMKQSGVWKHTVVVALISGDCHVPSSTLVDAHDYDRYRYPLSNYSGYTWYAITISGYRK
jgi:hypothetical protein